jgi:hypothetical protein
MLIIRSSSLYADSATGFEADAIAAAAPFGAAAGAGAYAGH